MVKKYNTAIHLSESDKSGKMDDIEDLVEEELRKSNNDQEEKPEKIKGLPPI